VNRLWQLHNIKPHLSRTLKLSRDAKFLGASPKIDLLKTDPSREAPI